MGWKKRLQAIAICYGFTLLLGFSLPSLIVLSYRFIARFLWSAVGGHTSAHSVSIRAQEVRREWASTPASAIRVAKVCLKSYGVRIRLPLLVY